MCAGVDTSIPFISIHALVKRATVCAGVDTSIPFISIHALVKRATLRHYYMDEIAFISIHALVKRATFCQNIATQHAIDFNPRPREEGDFSPCQYYTVYSISIHALVKRATQDTDKVLFKTGISIHALVKRATRTTDPYQISYRFQSTPS